MVAQDRLSRQGQVAAATTLDRQIVGDGPGIVIEFGALADGVRRQGAAQAVRLDVAPFFAGIYFHESGRNLI